MLETRRENELKHILDAAVRVMSQSREDGQAGTMPSPQASVSSSGIAPNQDKEDIRIATLSNRTHQVGRPIRNLEQLSDIDLFATLSEGLALIVDNATSLDVSAQHLHRHGDLRASEVIRGFAKEEAAKVLVLLDYVRCPRKSGQRAQVLNRFYGHVAKRIHAMACEFPRIASFGELSSLVERECRPWYLDGPNDIDWIFPNTILAKRDRDLYVDYVQDVTNAGGAYWASPVLPDASRSQCLTSDCVMLIQSLSRAGAISAAGLAEIADVWRGFAPEAHTDREELRDLIVETLDRLEWRCGALDEADARFVVWHWPFPLWPLTIREPRRDDGDLDGLREERKLTIEWMKETEARRDPELAISRSKVEQLNDAFTAWQSDVDARQARQTESKRNGFVYRPAQDFSELPSYVALQDMFRDLTGDERAALLALGWFAWERLADWPRIHERAVKQEPTTDENYQISCACYWLAGLERWEEKPRPFEAGRFRPLR